MSKRSQKPQPPWIDSYDLTVATYANWFNRLYDVALARFKWEGFEDSPFLDERFIEQFLFWQPLMAGYHDPVMGNLILPAMTSNNFDIIGDPKYVRAYGYNSNYQKTGLSKENCAYLWCNMRRSPDVIIIKQFAQRLTNIDRTIDLNLAAQKNPRIAYANENTKLSVQNMVYQQDKYDPWLYLKGNPSTDDIKNMMGVLDLGVQYIGLQLEQQKKETLAEALTYLGIESNYNMKAERQFTTEIQMTLGQVEADRLSPLYSRQKFCKDYNRLFNTNISVSMRSQLELTKIMEGREDEENLSDTNIEDGESNE